MSPVTFEIGKKYENMKGSYEVLAVDGDVMRIQWEDGEEIATSVIMQRRILERMEREREKGHTQDSPEKGMTETRTPSEKASESPSTPREEESPPQTTGTTGIKKQYLKTKRMCKVTFILPNTIAGNADSVCIVGDFNNWNNTANPMKKNKIKGFTATLELEPDREYQFRYLINGSKWENDPNADKYVQSPFEDSENSVVSI